MQNQDEDSSRLSQGGKVIFNSKKRYHLPVSFVTQCSLYQNLGMGLFAFKVKQIYVCMALHFKNEGIKSPDSRYMFYFDATKPARFKTIC